MIIKELLDYVEMFEINTAFYNQDDLLVKLKEIIKQQKESKI